MKNEELQIGQKVGKLTLLEKVERPGHPVSWHCLCECGNERSLSAETLIKGRIPSCRKCNRNVYEDCDDGKSVAVHINNGYTFYIDKADEPMARQYHWYVTALTHGFPKIENAQGIQLPWLITRRPQGMDVDHINHDRFDNRRANLRVCTRRQNQCNQGLQSNNTSGFVGVRYHAARGKYVARIKFCQHDVHLGYYPNILIAAQARNVAQWYLFGEFGIYPHVGPAPEFIKPYLQSQCAKGIDRVQTWLSREELKGIEERMGVANIWEIERNVTNPYDGVGILLGARGA